jgi:hypothetical protein
MVQMIVDSVCLKNMAIKKVRSNSNPQTAYQSETR